jgi:hypothetical protein
VSFGSEVEEFLAALKPGTRKVYGRELALFAEFLKEQKIGHNVVSLTLLSG